MQEIKSSGIYCKGNVTENFEMLPSSLFKYLELGVIKQSEFVLYVKLLQLYNVDYNYAFPTITQLMIYTGIGSKATVHKSIDTLEKVGLIGKFKSVRGNNNYVVFKPLDEEELCESVPTEVEKFLVRSNSLLNVAKEDKRRLEEYKEKIEAQEELIQAKQIIPTSTDQSNDL